MKLLLTGSGGFVGSNLVRFLIKNQYKDMSSLDRCENLHALHSIYANKSHQFHIADLCDEHVSKVIFELEKPDVVINCAYSKNPANQSKNIDATRNLVKLCNTYNSKLIHISHHCVYSGGENLKEIEATKSNDSALTYTKSYQEMVIQSCNNYNVIRPSNLFGPRQNVDQDSIVLNMYYSLLSGRKFIYQNLENIGMLYINDLCAAIVKVMEDGFNKEIYNVSGFKTTTSELFDEIKSITNLSGEIEYLNKTSKHLTLNSDKLKSLGWSRAWKHKQALVQTLEWEIKNKWFNKKNS